MGFFDKLSDSISSGSAKVVEKTKEISTVTNLNMQIDKDNKAIEKVYTEIGKLFFEQFKDVVVEKCPEQAARIDELMANVAKNLEAVRDAKGITICPQCGAELPRGTKFCSKCGFQVPEPVVEEPVVEGVKCANCGAVLPEGTVFCTSCGTKLEAPASEETPNE